MRDRIVGRIGLGLLALVGFTHSDTREQLAWMIEKIAGLRVFPDAEGKMNLGLSDVDGSVLVVSQFTLYANSVKGRRPSLVDAAPPDVASPLYEAFVSMLLDRGIVTATGEFGADMQVELVNDGPMTLWLER
jgi:D-tyrosyl-tRNA(Tyr) deacylase